MLTRQILRAALGRRLCLDPPAFLFSLDVDRFGHDHDVRSNPAIGAGLQAHFLVGYLLPYRSGNYLCNHSDSKHADLHFEMTCATATMDLAGEFCHDLGEPAEPCAPVTSAPAECKLGPGDAPASKQASIDF